MRERKFCDIRKSLVVSVTVTFGVRFLIETVARLRGRDVGVMAARLNQNSG
jgi:hypothetical protein